ncbi:hypothetical protein HYH03_018453 [Edaphochlamys debaryana]|uniref:Uncharacterized protein n=1 Tax=Edaphochlamys debaryana TaxID=47281 RepID=A0A835XFU5_9CHLO|nr:hypothetical protein HYH03_018453 [Edaphochlamys debaryana]|eukprot:KAG2482609.1 hypothetical protein HYH03_018453 [Edaphochlamys debaryana]
MASSPAPRAYVPPADDWEASVDALVPCGVLPALPALEALRQAVREAEGAPLLSAQPLLEAALACVAAQPAIPSDHHNMTALLLASAALEPLSQMRSTKAVLARLAADGSVNDEVDTDAGDAEELRQFQSQVSSAVLVDALVEALRSPDLVPEKVEGLRRDIDGLLRGEPPDFLPAVVRATLSRVRSADVLQANKSGRHALAGLFFQEAKRYKKKRGKAPILAQLPPLPPLRGYQRGVVGMVTVSWSLPLTPEALAGVQGAQGEEARLRAKAGGWDRNWFVRAPTGSGKTRMFIEVARAQAAFKPSLVVVVVLTVMLTVQHEASFQDANLPNTSISAHSGGSTGGASLTPAIWESKLKERAIGRSCVLTCTPVTLLQLLQSGAAQAEAIDLLVLDEAHHCHDEHPYAKVLEHVNRAPKAPRILAVSASPVSEVNQAELEARLASLLASLDARLEHVAEDDPEVAAVISRPAEVEFHMHLRPLDFALMASLRIYANDVAFELLDSLQHVQACGPDVAEELNWLRMNLADGAEGNDNALGKFLALGQDFARRYGCPNLLLTCHLLDVMRKCAALVEDGGFEGALPYLARKAAALCEAELAAAQGGGGVTAVAALELDEGDESDAGASSTEPALPGILAKLQEAAAAASLHAPQEATPAHPAAQASLPPAGNSCGDVTVPASSLIRKLLDAPDFRSALQSHSTLLQDCFASGQLLQAHTFPKFWTLLERLQRYKDDVAFRGIIFVRTRQAVYHVADMIRRCKQLGWLEPLELTGQKVASGRGLVAAGDRHSRGMSNAQAQLVLGLFKGSSGGAKVLIATSVAEEGLDITACNYVARYNAAATGIQRLQSKGRARTREPDVDYFVTMETIDAHLTEKSKKEERNMWEYNRRSGTADSSGADEAPEERTQEVPMGGVDSA